MCQVNKNSDLTLYNNTVECLQTSHLLGFMSLGDSIVNLFIKNGFFTNIENNYLLKIKKITLKYAWTTNQRNIC